MNHVFLAPQLTLMEKLKRSFVGYADSGYADMRICGYADMRICGYL